MNFKKIGVVHGRGPRDGPWTEGQCFQLSPVRHIPIPGVDESQWSKHPHWGMGCASLGMYILTGNGDVSHRECT